MSEELRESPPEGVESPEQSLKQRFEDVCGGLDLKKVLQEIGSGGLGDLLKLMQECDEGRETDPKLTRIAKQILDLLEYLRERTEPRLSQGEIDRRKAFLDHCQALK